MRLFGPEPIAAVVAERSPAAFWRALGRAARRVRVAELRLDYLGSVGAIARVVENLARRRPRLTLIATCRRRAAGGEFDGSAAAQLALLSAAARAGCAWVDVEQETIAAIPASRRAALLPPARRIISLHDFRRTPPRLETLYRKLRGWGGDLVKLAVTARHQRDNLVVLELAQRHRGRVIALAMGAAGLPSRILGLRAGSALTYAALESGSATAAGQMPLEEMQRVFRPHRLNARTRVYGVVGRPIGHSLSPAMHNAAFAARCLNAVYLPFEVRDLRDFLACVGPLGLGGFSVTAPHKESILRFLDGIDPLAANIGAVNTVVARGGGKLYGYNTDYVGVLRALERRLRLEGSRVLVVGAGGSARAVAFAVATAGAFVSISSRRKEPARALAQAVGGEAVPRAALRARRFDAIVHCTPVGQAPAVGESPLEPGELNCRVVIDLVYNPLETRLLRLARQRGLGAVPGWQILLEQGAAQFEIWTGLRAPLAVMRRALLARLKRSAGVQ